MYYCKNILSLLILAASFSTAAYDRVRTASGAECQSNSKGHINLTADVYSEESNRYYGNLPVEDKGAKVGISINFGGSKRLDCSAMYNNEVEFQKLELQRLKEELAILKQQQNLRSLNIPNPLNIH
ncbi:MAG: hypothetical protein ACRCT7_08325 [Shewanella sp.]|uniref:hypothetical protein n=1 Tax=Shewanella sp. SNU WT4 TaxID=2590015 RepID=UPI00112675CF|nr:hypothetical protein [Shewanella sp. SNU WT4]QDF67612.1 hypothetical protein FJQ87_13865 [Shewanella sp. SNU WT4]